MKQGVKEMMKLILKTAFVGVILAGQAQAMVCQNAQGSISINEYHAEGGVQPIYNYQLTVTLNDQIFGEILLPSGSHPII